jgi:RHS repeat-associated protein
MFSLVMGLTTLSGWISDAQSTTYAPIATLARTLAAPMPADATAPPLPSQPVSLPGSAIVPASTTVGYLPSSWDVASSGELTYTIPVDVPRGRAGIQPSLALTYHSSGGNGFVGEGWSLSGLSSITRCAKRRATEGVTEGITYDGDSYCLDGAKLRAVSGVDGADGAEYRTEADTFAKVVLHVALPKNNGPDGFTVWTKDGLRREYVKQEAQRAQSSTRLVDGKIESQSISLAAVPVAWLLTRVEDRAGNAMTYTYQVEQSGSQIEWRPDQILYTSSSSGPADIQTPHYGIKFHWEGRPDHEVSYEAGVERRLTQRLSLIEVDAPTPVTGYVGGYFLSYTTSAGSGRSLLKEVKRCGAYQGCLWAKQFDWYDAKAPTFAETVVGDDPIHEMNWPDVILDPVDPRLNIGNGWRGTYRTPRLHVLDLDGDGIDDVLYGLGGEPSLSFGEPAYVRLGSRDASSAVAPLASKYPLTQAGSAYPDLYVEPEHSRPVDIDGDGATEFLVRSHKWAQDDVYEHETLLKWQKGNHTFVASNALPDVPWNLAFDPDVVSDLTGPVFADLDGDGLLDLVRSEGLYPNYVIRTNLGGTFSGPIDSQLSSHCAEVWPPAISPRVTDLAGRGRANVVIGSTDAACAPQSGSSAIGETSQGAATLVLSEAAPAGSGYQTFFAAAPTGYRARYGDFNGDGLEDTLLLAAEQDPQTGRWDRPDAVLWNTGNGVSVATQGVSLIPRDLFNDVRVGDMNGDGRADLVSFHDQQISLLLSRGDGSFVREDLNADPGVITVTGPWFTPGQVHFDPAGHTLSQLGDFNGDGRLDLVTNDGTATIVHEQADDVQDRLKAVFDEKTVWPREVITYSNEWTDRPESQSGYTCAFPLSCIRRGMTVVRKVTSRAHFVDPADEFAGARNTFYSYEDPVSDTQGRGFLGFGEVRVWEPDRMTETVRTYDNRSSVDGRYPYAGVPNSVTTATALPTVQELQQSNGTPSSVGRARVTQTAATQTLKLLNAGASFAVMPNVSVTKEWEQGVSIDWGALQAGGSNKGHVFGIAVPANAPRQSSTASTWDDFGNLVSQTRNTVGGVFEEIDVGNYTNDIKNWLIGLPAAVTVSQAEPGGNPESRHVAYDYDTRGYRTAVHIEPNAGDPTLSKTLLLTIDDAGVLTTLTEQAAGGPDRVTHLEYAPLAGFPEDRVYPSQIWKDYTPAAYRPSQWFAVHPALGVLIAAEDVNGVQSQWQYDELGRLVTATQAGTPPIALSYSGRPDQGGGQNGLIVEATQGPVTVRAVSDALGRSLSDTVTGFDGTPITTHENTRDVLGRLIQSVQPGNPARVTTQRYDNLDRLLEEVRPDQSTIEIDYPSLFETHEIVAGTNESTTTADKDGRVVRKVEVLDQPPAQVTTKYAYAPFGQLAAITDDQGHVTAMTYDARGRRTTLSDPDRGLTTDTWNGFGDITQETHAASGQTRTFTYDSLGRQTDSVDADGKTHYEWDTSPHGIGQLASTLSPDHIATAYQYDVLSRLATNTLTDEQQIAHVIDYGYDAEGRLDTLAYPAVAGMPRLTLKYSYVNGYLKEIGNASPGQPYQPLWTVNARNADLALTDATLGNGVHLTPTYEPLSGRLQALMAFKPGVGNLMNLTYGYHANGLVRERIDQLTGRSETFGYDTLLRLTSWHLALPTSGGTNPQPAVDTTLGYVYDPIGNLLQVDRNGSTIESNGYGDVNGLQPHTLTHHFDVPANQHTFYSYDTQGRQTSSTAGRNASYTTFDLPKTFTDGAGTGTLAYDAFGTRVRKTDPAGTTLYVDGLYERRETASPASTQHVFHIVGSEGPVAQLTWTDAGTSTMTYLLQDQLGSASIELDDSGAVTAQHSFDPFGQRVNADGSTYGGVIGLIHEGFAGQEHDDAWGLINFNGRMYDPSLKRFLTADPIVSHPGLSQSWNAYSYVMNSPLNFTDPTGYRDGCGEFSDCPPNVDAPPIGPGPVGQGNTGGTPGTPSGGVYGSGVTQVGNAGAAGGTFGQGPGGSGGGTGKSDGEGFRPAPYAPSGGGASPPPVIVHHLPPIVIYDQNGISRGRQMIDGSVGMMCRHYPSATWACGVQKYLSNKTVVGVHAGRRGFQGQYQRPSGRSIELNIDVLKRGLEIAFTVFHEVGHRVDHTATPDLPAGRIEGVTRLMEGEAIAQAFALMAFADYMTASGRLDHLDDREFYLSAGLGEDYETTIDTTDGRAFVNYMMSHPQARSDNDPEVFRLAYAAGLAWIGQHAGYYVPYYGGP